MSTGFPQRFQSRRNSHAHFARYWYLSSLLPNFLATWVKNTGVWALDKRNGYVSMDDDEGRRVLAEEHSLDNVLQDRSRSLGA